jgi:ligand-binding sensor domain-containing protein
MGTYTYNEKGEFLGSGARNWSNWLVVLIWIVTCCLNIGAQNLLIRPYPFAHQLYTNHIYEIFQDQEGYIWIGTSASLQRFVLSCCMQKKMLSSLPVSSLCT